MRRQHGPTPRGWAAASDGYKRQTPVPDGEAKRVWQRLGATFGSDSNAETTPTQTVYKLDLPNANKTSLDESLKIFAGMLSSPGLSITAVNPERPVALAELRDRHRPKHILNT